MRDQVSHDARDQPPTASPAGRGVMGWLGRQVGYVAQAIRADPNPRLVERRRKVREAPHPGQAGVTLRRTTIDEVLRDDAALPGESTRPRP